MLRRMQYTMMLRFSLVNFLLFAIQDATVLAQSSSASWLYPVTDGLIINIIDTVVLQWESNYDDPWMQMWCQNGTAGDNVVQGSDFKVQASGSYNYIMEINDPKQSSFPVACHAQLATAENGGGVDSPVGVTFVSLASEVGGAKTFSLGSSTSSASTATSSTSSPSTSPTSTLPSNTSPAVSTSTSTASGGLSAGSKAGIGIAAAVGAIGIAGAAAWYFWRKRSAVRKNTKNTEAGIPELGDDLGRSELAAPHGQQEMETKANNKPSRYEMAA